VFLSNLSFVGCYIWIWVRVIVVFAAHVAGLAWGLGLRDRAPGQDWAPRHAEYVGVIDDAALEGDSVDALSGQRR
jgi:hypothetical protein